MKTAEKKQFFGERNNELDNDLFGNPKHSTDYHGYTDAMFSGLHFSIDLQKESVVVKCVKRNEKLIYLC